MEDDRLKFLYDETWQWYTGLIDRWWNNKKNNKLDDNIIWLLALWFLTFNNIVRFLTFYDMHDDK